MAGLALDTGTSFCLSRSTEDLPSSSYNDDLNAEQLEKLLYSLESTENPIVTENALITLVNNVAFSAKPAIIRDLGGVPIVEN